MLGLVLYALFLYNAAQAEYDTITTEQMTHGSPVPLLGWITSVGVGMIAILGFSSYRDITISRRDWSILIGLIAVLLFLPFVYVMLVLIFLAYILWRNARPPNLGPTLATPPMP
jgi:chromate transport protein ChrA